MNDEKLDEPATCSKKKKASCESGRTFLLRFSEKAKTQFNENHLRRERAAESKPPRPFLSLEF